MSHGSFKESLRVPTERLQVFRMKGHCFACQLIVYFFIWIEYASARGSGLAQEEGFSRTLPGSRPGQGALRQMFSVRPSIDKTDDALNV